MKLTLQKSDNIGILASTLCMLHCLATPFLFVAHTCCNATPIWWQWVDYFFLAISFFAVYHTTQTSLNKLIKLGLWVSWVALFVVIVDEKTVIFHLSETCKYIAAFSLVALHFYNQKYCQCKNDKCYTYNE